MTKPLEEPTGPPQILAPSPPQILEPRPDLQAPPPRAGTTDDGVDGGRQRTKTTSDDD